MQVVQTKIRLHLKDSQIRVYTVCQFAKYFVKQTKK